MGGRVTCMAISPAHKLGQMIGDELEAAVRQPLQEVATELGLYLDYKGVRRARGRKRKVSWVDHYGNTHDLDYVLEECGSGDQLGYPRGFIETAWRRYTKHSRNKSQEIQGAIGPLAQTYTSRKPFLGVILAGEFTEGSLEQLRTQGFQLAYCRYETVVQAFATEGFDVSSEEDSPDAELQQKVDALQRITPDQRMRIRKQLLALHAVQFSEFFKSLRTNLNRHVVQIVVLPLSGISGQFDSVDNAIKFVMANNELASASMFVRYEIDVRYSNGDNIRGAFGQKQTAVDFLQTFQT